MQYTERAQQRLNISQEVANTLRHRIADGRLAEGQRINEVKQAASLGVSRTPLREALQVLVAEGTLLAIPRRGYFVRELTVEEFQSLYAIRVLLDPEALRTSRRLDPDQIDRLSYLNRQLKTCSQYAGTPVDDVIDLDDSFHLVLIEKCGNEVLCDLIRQFMGRTRRYEYAYMKDVASVSNAFELHESIIHYLKHNDRTGACEALRQNLTSGIGSITDWLQQRSVAAENEE